MARVAAGQVIARKRHKKNSELKQYYGGITTRVPRCRCKL
jgi:hypothetical protein